jgi:hypothetical protein
MPPPPQMAIIPYLDRRLPISLSSVMRILAPVAVQQFSHRATW